MYIITISVTDFCHYSFFLSFFVSFFLSVCLCFSLSPSFFLQVPSIYMPRHSQSSATLIGKYITCTCKCSVQYNVHVCNYHCLVSFFLSSFLSFCLAFFLTVGLSFFYSHSFSLQVPSIYMPRHSQSRATLVGKYITCTCKCSLQCNVHVFNYHLCHCLVSIFFLPSFLSVFLSFSLSVFHSLFTPLFPCRFLLFICLVILNQV